MSVFVGSKLEAQPLQRCFFPCRKSELFGHGGQFKRYWLLGLVLYLGQWLCICLSATEYGRASTWPSLNQNILKSSIVVQNKFVSKIFDKGLNFSYRNLWRGVVLNPFWSMGVTIYLWFWLTALRSWGDGAFMHMFSYYKDKRLLIDFIGSTQRLLVSLFTIDLKEN